MRIAIDCRSVFPGMGGIGRRSLSIASALASIDTGNEYFLFFTHRKQEQKLVPQANVTEISFECGMIDERWEQFVLPGLLANHGIDVYHGTCFSIPLAQACRYVVTIHDIVFEHRRDLVSEGLADYLCKWAQLSARWSDLVVTVSEFSKKEICEAYGVPENKVRVVYGAVSDTFRRNSIGTAPTERTAAATSRSYLLYVGALEPKKNVPLLLEAFKGLLAHAEAREFSLVLVGGQGGKAYDIRKDISRLGLEKHVIVTGHVSDPELLYLYDNALLFVYPSLYEGFGLPPLEAMSRGVPTVVSDRTSLPEVVGDAAVIADPSNCSDLTGKMNLLIANKKLRQQLSEKGKARARQFSWEKSARQLLQLYEELCREKVC